MARNLVQIAVEVVDKASKKLRGVNKELGNLGDSSEKASKQTALLTGAQRAFAGVLTVATIRALVKTATELGELGARAASLETAFTNLAGGANAAAGYIDAIKEASRGTISEMDAMQAATTALTLDVVSNADEMARLTEIAVTLGKAQGLTATQAIKDLTTALGRQSPMILDNLGITMKLSEAYSSYADRLGKSVGELTDAEKKQAFLNEALERGAKVAGELGGVLEDSQSAVEQSEAAWADLRKEIGMNFKDAVAGAKKETAGLARTMADAMKIMRTTREAQALLGDEVYTTVHGIRYYHDGLDQLVEAQKLYNFYLDGAEGQLWDYQDRERQATEALIEHAVAAADFAPHLKDYDDRFVSISGNVASTADGFRALREAEAAAGDAAEEAAPQHEAQAGALAEAAKSAGELAMSLKDATEKQIAKELIGMLDPKKMGAGYWTAITDIGESFDLMDQKSIALTENLPKLAEAMEEGLIPPGDSAEAFSALVQDAEDGDVSFSGLLVDFGRMPGELAKMNQPLMDVGGAMEPLPGWASGTADGIQAIGDNAGPAASKLSNFVDQVERLRDAGGLPSIGGRPSRTTYTGKTEYVGPEGSYQHGGVVPGPLGAPQLAVVHGGETVVPPGKGAAGTMVNVHLHGDIIPMDDDSAIERLANRITSAMQARGAYRGAYRRN